MTEKKRYDWQKMTTHQRIALMRFDREFCNEEEPQNNTKYVYTLRSGEAIISTHMRYCGNCGAQMEEGEAP